MKLYLTNLKNGETGVIISTDPNLERYHMCTPKLSKSCGKRFKNTRFVKRLTDLGLTPGINVTVVKSAPFNGPLEICVRNSRLAIGRGMASRILVEVKR